MVSALVIVVMMQQRFHLGALRINIFRTVMTTSIPNFIQCRMLLASVVLFGMCWRELNVKDSEPINN